MSQRTRLKNIGWMPGGENGKAETWDMVQIAILLDIRDELQALNRVFACPNFTAMPNTLREIRSNTESLVKRKLAPKKKRVRHG